MFKLHIYISLNLFLKLRIQTFLSGDNDSVDRLISPYNVIHAAQQDS